MCIYGHFLAKNSLKNIDIVSQWIFDHRLSLTAFLCWLCWKLTFAMKSEVGEWGHSPADSRRPPKRTLHSFTAGTLLPPTSQLQMTSTPRNILLVILGYISSNWRGVQGITDKLKLSFTRLNIQAKRLAFCKSVRFFSRYKNWIFFPRTQFLHKKAF